MTNKSQLEIVKIRNGRWEVRENGIVLSEHSMQDGAERMVRSVNESIKQHTIKTKHKDILGEFEKIVDMVLYEIPSSSNEKILKEYYVQECYSLLTDKLQERDDTWVEALGTETLLHSHPIIDAPIETRNKLRKEVLTKMGIEQ